MSEKPGAITSLSGRPFDILLIAYVAELALTVWLLVIGVTAEKWEQLASAA